jgi:hypothetical protein
MAAQGRLPWPPPLRAFAGQVGGDACGASHSRSASAEMPHVIGAVPATRAALD